MRLLFLLLAAVAVVGCQTGIPADALDLKPDSLERRQLESRRFDGGKESDILAACSGVAQDLGCTIDEAETKLGVMVASKVSASLRARPPETMILALVSSGRSLLAISELTKAEVKILLQSLSNCLATCKTHAAKPSARCPDCDSAKAVKTKLEKQAKA